MRAVLVIITLYIMFTIRLLTAQSAAPAGGRPVRPHHLAPPRAATDPELP